MKPLTVNCELIAHSMRDVCRETSEYFFDKTTGRVFSLSRALMKAFAEKSPGGRSGLPDWDASLMPVAREIMVLGNPDYVRIPEAFGRPEHRWMLEFSETVRNAKQKQRLALSLKGRESCQRFKEILKEDPEESNRWTVFCQKKWEETVQKWLEGYMILAVGSKPQKRAAA